MEPNRLEAENLYEYAVLTDDGQTLDLSGTWKPNLQILEFIEAKNSIEAMTIAEKHLTEGVYGNYENLWVKRIGA